MSSSSCFTFAAIFKSIRRFLHFPALLLLSILALVSLFLYIESQRNATTGSGGQAAGTGGGIMSSFRHNAHRVYPKVRQQQMPPPHHPVLAASNEDGAAAAAASPLNNHDDDLDSNANFGNNHHHQEQQSSSSLVFHRQRKTAYLARVNMGSCPPVFGRVTVLVIVVESSYKTHYAVAQRSLKCYLRTANYTFRLIDLDHDERVNRHCKHDQLFFKKQCAVSVYLPDSDWTLVLDADAGVVNPNHCIEEWIDDRVDLVFYERFFNWEIASGNYLARNSEFARAFTMAWANMQYTQPKNFSGADNGALQLHILGTVIPGAKAEYKACKHLWQLSDSYERYMGYVSCVKTALGATRLWPGKLRILRRAHGWVRDWFLTMDAWCEKDFMLHGWKAQNLSSDWKSPFRRVPNPIECVDGYAGWEWRNELRVSTDEIRRQLAMTEKSSGLGFPRPARVLAYLSEPDVGECYPDCDEWT